MGIAVYEIPKGVCPPPSEIGTLGAFFQPSTTSEKKLVQSDERLVRELVNVLDRQLIAAVEARSVREFCSVRDNVFLRYVRSLRALRDTVSNLVSDDVLEFISDSVMPGLTDDLEKQRDRFGEKLTDQAIFTLWTVQKIRALGHEIADVGSVSDDKKVKDNALMYEYHAASVWAQFHLDVLFAAMKFDRAICDEIRETICDGLRASVNAYAIMKDALALRYAAAVEDNVSPNVLPWDAEDEQLLASSMKDMDDDAAAS
jgi:hypothetical protein